MKKRHPVIAVCPRRKIAILAELLVMTPFIVFTIMVAALRIRSDGTHQLANGMLLPLFAFCVSGVMTLLYTSPTFWIHDEGITILFPFRKVFVQWDKIVEVRQFSFWTDVFFERQGTINSLIGLVTLHPNARIRFSSHRRNLKIFMKMIHTNIPERLD